MIVRFKDFVFTGFYDSRIVELWRLSGGYEKASG